jgi:hypothetical protein
MAYEIRGSMIVYLVLLVTAGFTARNRVASLFGLLTYSIYNNTDVLAEVPFYTGALLADLSLVLNEQTLSLPSWNIGPPCGSLYRTLRSHWPIIMFVVGLYIGSYPPNSPDLSVWSQQLYNLGLMIFPTSCIPFVICSNCSRLQMGIPTSQRSTSHLCTSLFRLPSTYPFSSIFRLPRKRFLSYVSYPLVPHAQRPRMGCLRLDSRIRWIRQKIE